jgi:hypothetical protein
MFGNAKNEAAFYEAFASHAAQSVAAAKLVRDMLEDPSKAPDISKQVNDAEHRGDKITHETIARLRKTWITPFDRSDIHVLISSLDDVLDLIEAVSERVLIFELKDRIGTACELAAQLCEATVAVEQAVKLCVEINRIENKADSLYRQGIAAAFAPGNDPLMALKLRDIYDNLESATDRCEDVANVLEGVVLEYG